MKAEKVNIIVRNSVWVYLIFTIIGIFSILAIVITFTASYLPFSPRYTVLFSIIIYFTTAFYFIYLSYIYLSKKISQEYVLLFFDTYFIYKDDIYEYNGIKFIKKDINNLSRFINVQFVINYKDINIEFDMRFLDVDFETIKTKLKHLQKMSHVEWE